MFSRVPKGHRRVAAGVYADDELHQLIVRPGECREGEGLDYADDRRLHQLVESLHRHTWRDPLTVAVEVEEIYGLGAEEVDRG